MVRKCEVRTKDQALAYITDCNLATVCDMAMKKSRPKYEFERQISIAQTAIDWMVNMGVDFSGTRAEDAQKAGTVQLWAMRFYPNSDARQPTIHEAESNDPKETS